jgi:hypothetical protein
MGAACFITARSQFALQLVACFSSGRNGLALGGLAIALGNLAI